MTANSVLSWAVRLVMAYGAVVFACVLWGQHYAQFLLPLYGWEIRVLAPRYDVTGLESIRQQGEQVVALSVTLASFLKQGDWTLPPGIGMTSSTLQGHALQHVIVMLSLLLAWPARRWHDYAIRLGLMIPALLAVEVLDVPLVLLGSLDDLLSSQLNPDAGDTLLVRWMDFLNGGGRLALSVAAAVGTLALQHLLLYRINAMRDDSPIRDSRPADP